MRNESVMKWKEKERKRKDFPDILHFSPIFSIFLRNSPIFSRNDRKNDREKRVIRKRLWNDMERNGMIFRIFSMIFHGYSVKIPYICIGLTK